MNDFEKKFNPTEGFEVASEDEKYQEGDLATSKLEEWLKDDNNKLFEKLANSQQLKSHRFDSFQKDFNGLQALHNEIKELKGGLSQIEDDEITKNEVEDEIAKKIKELQKEMLFVAKEYMDVIELSSESLVSLEDLNN